MIDLRRLDPDPDPGPDVARSGIGNGNGIGIQDSAKTLPEKGKIPPACLLRLSPSYVTVPVLLREAEVRSFTAYFWR